MANRLTADAQPHLHTALCVFYYYNGQQEVEIQTEFQNNVFIIIGCGPPVAHPWFSEETHVLLEFT